MASLKRIPVMLALAAWAAAWLIGAAAAAGIPGPAEAGPGFRRGINVYQAMHWATVEPGPGHAFAYPPFPDPSIALTAAELQALRRTGFDFVRFTVDPGPFLELLGTRRDELDRMLIGTVSRILAAGLSVVVDFHPSEAQPDYTGKALTRGVETPVFQAYLRLLARSTGLLEQPHSRRIALELMNEPPVAASAWQPMLEAAYAAVRSRSTDLLVVLDGGEEASPAAMTAIRTAALVKDQAALFTFHYYAPYQFAHQGASWNAARYLADVPYPALARPLQDSLDATAEAIARSDLSQQEKSRATLDARARLEGYRRSAFDGRTIAEEFNRVADWARSQDLPPERILLGEFGARTSEPQLHGGRVAERARWFHDVRDAAQAHGFGWAAWAYRDIGGFGLVRSATSNEIEPAIADALGLTSRPHAERSSAD